MPDGPADAAWEFERRSLIAVWMELAAAMREASHRRRDRTIRGVFLEGDAPTTRVVVLRRSAGRDDRHEYPVWDHSWLGAPEGAHSSPEGFATLVGVNVFA